MEIDFFSRRVNAFQERVASLFSELLETKPDQERYVKESFFELVKALEELQTAEEELNVQVIELEQIRQQAEAERQNYLGLFQFSPDGYIVTDINGVIREANVSACRMLRKKLQYVIGKPLITWVEEVERKSFRDHINHIVREGATRTLEAQLLHHKGNDREILRFTAGPVRDATGEIKAIRWILYDGTHASTAVNPFAEHRDSFQTLFQTSPIGILLLDRSGFALETNPAAARLLGFDPWELKHLTFIDYIQPEDLERLVTQYSRLGSETDHFRQEVRIRSRKRGLAWVRLSIARFENASSQPGYAIAILEDITEQKETSRKLAELQETSFKANIALRQSLAQDLKTGPMEDLSLILHRMENINPTGVEQANELEEIRMALQYTLARLTEKASELANETQISFDLKQAISTFMQQVAWENPSISCDIQCSDTLHSIAEPVQKTLFNIFSDIVQNRVHQARPSTFDIHAERIQNTVVLEIQDDGPGEKLPAQAEALIREGQFEYAQAIEQLEALHGHISADGEMGIRSTIRIVAPLHPPFHKEMKARDPKLTPAPPSNGGRADNKAFNSQIPDEMPYDRGYDRHDLNYDHHDPGYDHHDAEIPPEQDQ